MINGVSIGSNEVILSKSVPNYAVTVHPLLKNKSKDVTLLIMIKGAVMENDQEVGWTGSYLIVTVIP